MPDHETQVREALPELEWIDVADLQEGVVEAWTLGLERGGWRDVTDVPYAWNIHEVTNVEHVRGVARIARDAARTQREFHGADPDLDVALAAALLHDVGKCYEYVAHVDDDLLDDPDPRYAAEAIPHFIGEVPSRTLEAELVKSANAASSNAITQSTMGITLQEWVEEYSQTQD